MIDYKLDTGDGQFCKSSMPATVACEIVKRSGKVSASGEEGFELAAGDMRFPAAFFEFEDGEVDGLQPAAEPAEVPETPEGTLPERPARSHRGAGKKRSDGE